MADVLITCNPNDAAENITSYHFFKDDAEIGNAANPEFTDPGVAPGVHKYEVAAENEWGVGEKSDPAYTPVAASKPGNVAVKIVLTVG